LPKTSIDFISIIDNAILMSAEDILKDSSLVAIIAGIIGLIILVGDSLAWVGVVFLGVIALFFGITNYLRNRNDVIALIAAILGIIVILVSIYYGVIR
jgi:hypothetical protein